MGLSTILRKRACIAIEGFKWFEIDLVTYRSQSSGLSESLYPSTMKLETLLSSSCSSHDKRGIGYVDEKFIPTNSEYVFVKVGENESLSSSKFQANSSESQTRKQKCHCCSKIRHEAKNCHRKMVDQRDEFDPNWLHSSRLSRITP